MTTIIETDETDEPESVECSECGTAITESWLISNGDEVCEDCRLNYTECEHCDSTVAIDETTHVDDRTVCNDCLDRLYVSCADCGEYVKDYRATGTVHGEQVCPSCRESNYSYCDNCYEYYNDDYSYCPDCGDRDGTAGGLIHSYGYSPMPRFLGEGPLYMGFELELSTDWTDLRGCAELADDVAGSISYLKEDSSIDCGFEFVTHPMSHTYAVESFPWPLLEKLERAGADGYNNGLHVHVSRSAFKDCGHTYRWMKLLHRNKDDVQVIARRNSNEWAAWRDSDRQAVKDYAKGGSSYRRYSAINVQNEATFELRIFRGTTKINELRAALDLVAASVEYTRDLTAADIHRRDGWSWSAFIAWCAAQDGRFAALVDMATATVAA